MNYLIDTNIFIWASDDSEKLTKEVSSIIKNPDNKIYISLASYWEIEIKKNLGKIKIASDFEYIANYNGYQILEIKTSHIRNLKNLEKIHNDPFDRLIISQSVVENLTLVTSDKIIAQYKANTILN
ncbi:MAG TPA: PIN domain nuclease [Alphaproteobacteria bacterium]|nr:PIN domain nuclease [Alphaproteobacteria bacterium]